MNTLPRLVSRHAGAALRRSTAAASVRVNGVSVRTNITYSGGQATEGQGGWYGSGGARVIDSTDIDTTGRHQVLALAADVQLMQSTAVELQTLESLLLSETESSKGAVTTKSMELKNSIKKLITGPELNEALNNLEIQGEPVWGLSTEEREMIGYLRDQMNQL